MTRKEEGLTVVELFELLKKVIDDGKGDYKMKIDVNEYWVIELSETFYFFIFFHSIYYFSIYIKTI